MHTKVSVDPNSCLMYIVRERFYEYLKIPPFENIKNNIIF